MRTDTKFVDLHTHSTASDGTDTPAAVVAVAAEAGLASIALTDHDTLAGLEEAQTAGQRLGVEVVRGCEISSGTEFGELHILGLWLPSKAAVLTQKLAWLRQKRQERNQNIVQKLQDLGLGITMEDVLTVARGESVGRPHIAAALVDKGYVASKKEAFREYLGDGGKAYLPKTVLSPEESVSLLAGLGATVSLAHPMLRKLPSEWLESMIGRLKDCGLTAIEAYHSEHSETQTGYCLALARRFGLGVSGGSDYHGGTKPNIKIGRGYGGLRVSFAVLEELRRQRIAAGLPV
ncbi:MAG: PHP domain-containing protein [Desulfovibrio sp.]|nr:PHP domain-containing protein [Desulfovibrio sp.]